jgi:hypothetical protein
MPGESAHARVVKGVNAPRVLCGGIIALDEASKYIASAAPAGCWSARMWRPCWPQAGRQAFVRSPDRGRAETAADRAHFREIDLPLDLKYFSI